MRRCRLAQNLLVFATVAAGACTDEPPSGTSEDTGMETGEDTERCDDEAESCDEVIGFLDVGFGERDFTPLEEGGELRIVWGGQGSAMFPMPIRSGAITLPENPRDYTDEAAPLLDVSLDIAGEEPGACGHFKCVNNYPMAFDILPDGTYEFMYVSVIMPDGVDVAALNGKTAELRVELDPIDSATLVRSYRLTVSAEPPPF